VNAKLCNLVEIDHKFECSIIVKHSDSLVLMLEMLKWLSPLSYNMF